MERLGIRSPERGLSAGRGAWPLSHHDQRDVCGHKLLQSRNEAHAQKDIKHISPKKWGRGVTTVKTVPSATSEGSPAILVVDDDGQILELVSRFLRANGFRVHAARNGVEMMECLRRVSVDLIVLDLMLPGKGGLDLCRELRQTSTLPVIMLTAKGDDVDRIVGLEVGADDYLPKPFNPRELLARINAVLRRARTQEPGSPQQTKRAFLFGGWRLETLKRELTGPGGVVVDLSTGEYELLTAFLEAPQRVLTREFLLDAARNRSLDAFDRSIDVQVSRLRRKLDGAEDLIKTVRGAGYLFAADVTRG
jgi:two-component system OmpR family response regulator